MWGCEKRYSIRQYHVPHRVDTVTVVDTLASLISVSFTLKDVSQVAVAVRARDLNPLHPKRVIDVSVDLARQGLRGGVEITSWRCDEQLTVK